MFPWNLLVFATILSIANATKCHKIGESSFSCLQKKVWSRKLSTKDKHFFSSPKHVFTLLNASRAQMTFPKPRIYVGCWAFTIKTETICCTSIGNRYQLDWTSTSLNNSNCSATNCCPISQNIPMKRNAQIIENNGFNHSIGFEELSATFKPSHKLSFKRQIRKR